MNKGLRNILAKQKQKKRLKNVDHECSTRQKGRYKKNHIGCGCLMCKPFKHKMADKMKASDRKRYDETLRQKTIR